MIIQLVRSIRKHGLGRITAMCLAVAVAFVGLAWGVVEVTGLHPLYIRLVAVVAFISLPMLVGLAWAIGEPDDATGTGNVVRD